MTSEVSGSAARILDGTTWAEFCDSLKAAGAHVLDERVPMDPFHRAEGFRYLSRLTRAALETFVEDADPQAHVLLRTCHETIKMGADNPDNVYLSAPVHPDYSYRIVGTRGSVHYLGVGTYEGGYGSGGSLPPAGYLTLERSVDPDAPVEILLRREPDGSSQLQLPLSPRTRSVVVRQTFLDRQRETPARLRIERCDGPHVPLPLTAAKLTRGLRGAGRFVVDRDDQQSGCA